MRVWVLLLYDGFRLALRICYLCWLFVFCFLLVVLIYLSYFNSIVKFGFIDLPYYYLLVVNYDVVCCYRFVADYWFYCFLYLSLIGCCLLGDDSV